MDKKRRNRLLAVLLCVVLLAVCIAVVVWLWAKEEDSVPVGTESGTASGTTTTTTADATTSIPVWTGDAPELEGTPYFPATVLEIGEDWLLVEGSQDGSIAGQVILTVEKIPFAPAVGDEVKIWHTGQVMPSYPPRMIAVWVEKIG